MEGIRSLHLAVAFFRDNTYRMFSRSELCFQLVGDALIERFLPRAHGFDPEQLGRLQASFVKLKRKLRPASDAEQAMLASALIESFIDNFDLQTAEEKATAVFKNSVIVVRQLAAKDSSKA